MCIFVEILYNSRTPLQYNEFGHLFRQSFGQILIGLINYSCTVSVVKEDVYIV